MVSWLSPEKTAASSCPAVKSLTPGSSPGGLAPAGHITDMAVQRTFPTKSRGGASPRPFLLSEARFLPASEMLARSAPVVHSRQLVFIHRRRRIANREADGATFSKPAPVGKGCRRESLGCPLETSAYASDCLHIRRSCVRLAPRFLGSDARNPIGKLTVRWLFAIIARMRPRWPTPSGLPLSLLARIEVDHISHVTPSQAARCRTSAVESISPIERIDGELHSRPATAAYAPRAAGHPPSEA